MISRNLRQLTSTRFKQLIHHITRTHLLAAISGFISGAVSQSAAVSVFITTGFHTAGLLTFRQSMVIINWANIGTSFLIFVIIINVKLLILFFIGLIGLAYFLKLDKTIRLQIIFQFLLGVSLLFLGVIYIKSGAVPMQSLSWFRGLLEVSSGSMILIFLAGALLTVIAQSGPTVTVVALSLLSVGVLPMLQTFMIVLGTGIGSAINILVLSFKLKGTGKQLYIYQSIFKTTGVIAVMLLLMLYYLFYYDQNQTVFSILSANPGEKVAWLFLIMQLLPALLLNILQKPLLTLLQKISPSAPEDEWSRPEYISEHALDEPETALLLAEKEQLRIMHFLPEYLNPVSSDHDNRPVHSHQVLHDCFSQVDHQIYQYLEKLLKRPSSAAFQERILYAQQFSVLLHDLESNIFEFVATIQASPENILIQSFAINLIESLRTIIDTAIDTFDNPDVAGIKMMLSMTSDKGNVLQKIRQEYFQKNATIDISVRQSLFSLTILFDRICWQLKLMTTIRQKVLTG